MQRALELWFYDNFYWFFPLASFITGAIIASALMKDKD